MPQDGMTIKLTGTDQLKRNLSKIDKSLRGQAAVRIVVAGGDMIADEARKNIHETFSKHQKGELTNSISVEGEQKGSGAVAHVRPHRVYARIQELGGTIVPKKAGGFLVWRDPDTGKLCRARKVTLTPRPYLRTAAVENTDLIVRAMTDQSLKEIENAVGK